MISLLPFLTIILPVKSTDMKGSLKDGDAMQVGKPWVVVGPKLNLHSKSETVTCNQRETY